MAVFTIYTTETCPYCVDAKKRLDQLGHQYEEKRVDLDPELHAEMKKRAQKNTVPQIFINDYKIGGRDDLVVLINKNELDMVIEVAS